MADFDPEAPLNRIKGESKKAHSGFMDYFLAGTGRSLRDLHQRYQDQAAKVAKNEQHDNNEPATEKPPTHSWWTICNWSKNNHWQARIARQTEIDNEIALAQFQQRHMTGPEVIARLSDMGRADIAEFADVRSPADLDDTLNSHVIKKITVQARKHKDGTITAKTTIELHDSQAALEKLARHLGLFEQAGDSEDKPMVIKVLKGVSMDDL